MRDIFSTISLRISTYSSLSNNFTLSQIFIARCILSHKCYELTILIVLQKEVTIRCNLKKIIMFASFNLHRDAEHTSIVDILHEDEIMQNELNSRSSNSSLVEIVQDIVEIMQHESNDYDFDASVILVFDLDVNLEQAKRRLRNLKKLQKIREIETKIRLLKQKTKKMMSKLIVFSSFSNSLMQSTFASKEFLITSTMNRANDALASRRRTFKFDKIFLYHDKSIKEHRNYVRNLTTIFRLIFDDFLTKNFKIVYVMQFLAKKSKKI